MRLYSKHGIARFTLAILGVLWVLALLLVVVNAALSCVDENGCTRAFCQTSWMKPQYQQIILLQGQNCNIQ